MKKTNIDIFKDICYEIENDQKFKLPWTINEVKESVNQLFENIEV